MDFNQIERRQFLAAAGSLAVFPMSTNALNSKLNYETNTNMKKRTRKADFPVKAISSGNGLRATKKAYELMMKGEDTLDAAIAGVAIVENDPRDTSVGYGGLPNEMGVVELDAAVMHGPTHRAGGVGALQNIKNPAQVAKVVMDQTDHVLLVGEGALNFARAHGFPEENLLTERARKIWLFWKQTLSDKDDWLAPRRGTVDKEVAAFFKLPVEKLGSNVKQSSVRKIAKHKGKKFVRPTGTIHCAAMNSKGELSCTTTTSGLAFKIPGRVGDSPIIGAGLYCDNEVGSCGSTGRGEANLQNLCCAMGVELMRHGASPKESGMEVLRRVAHKTSEDHLLDEKGRPNFGLNFYLMNNKGEHAGVAMWGPAEFSVSDKKGTRREKCSSLYTRERQGRRK